MIEKNKSLSVFLLHFLERLNGCESIEKKITESLTDICTFYKFKKGFVYQTDGFRYFFLKETVGNEDHSLKRRFEMSEMTKIHSDRMKVKKIVKERLSGLLDLLIGRTQLLSRMRNCKPFIFCWGRFLKKWPFVSIKNGKCGQAIRWVAS